MLPLLSSYIAKWGQLGKPRRDGGYDNADPRAWLARQGDWRARANAAQANSFEALPFFIGAVIIAHQLGAPQPRLDLLAWGFVALRLVYIALCGRQGECAQPGLDGGAGAEHRHPVRLKG